jgi:hypothetical protein
MLKAQNNHINKFAAGRKYASFLIKQGREKK